MTNGILLAALVVGQPRRPATRILADARRARRRGADAVIVNLHWGDGVPARRRAPCSAASPRRLPRSRDVTAIVGQHVHVVQPIRGRRQVGRLRRGQPALQPDRGVLPAGSPGRDARPAAPQRRAPRAAASTVRYVRPGSGTATTRCCRSVGLEVGAGRLEASWARSARARSWAPARAAPATETPADERPPPRPRRARADRPATPSSSSASTPWSPLAAASWRGARAPGARAALRLMDDPVRVISTVQVGITGARHPHRRARRAGRARPARRRHPGLGELRRRLRRRHLPVGRARRARARRR